MSMSFCLVEYNDLAYWHTKPSCSIFFWGTAYFQRDFCKSMFRFHIGCVNTNLDNRNNKSD